MKKTTRTARKVLSVFLSVLMILTTLTVAAPGIALAADTYYVRVYLNIYDGASDDGYGNAYTVVTDSSSEYYGKPNSYSWKTNAGYYGNINMAGFTLFYDNDKKYKTYDLNDDLVAATTTLGNKWTSMDELTLENFADCQNKVEKVYTFELDSIPSSLFWINDENNGTSGETSFGFHKITVAKDANSEEKVLWTGLSGSESYMYNYYGTITPTGIITPWNDWPSADSETFYKAYTTSFADIWFVDQVPTSVEFDSPATINYTIPRLDADDSSSKYTRPAKVYDQYGGLIEGLTPTSYYIEDANGNKVNSSALYSDGNVFYIKKEAQKLYPGTESNTFYLVADYNGITGRIQLNLTNPKYNVSYENLQGVPVLPGEYVYGTVVPSPDVKFYANNDNATHFVYIFPESITVEGDTVVKLNKTDTTEPHNITAYTTTKEATYEAPGEEQGTCTKCNATVTREIPQLTDGNAPVITLAGNGNAESAIFCGDVNVAVEDSRTFTLAVTKDGEDYAVADTASFTLTEAGTYVITATDASNNVATKTVTINAAHTVETWTKVDDNNHSGICTVCGETVTAAHTFVNPVLTRPTLVDGTWTDGTYTYTCVCGETKTEPAKRADYSELDDAVAALEELKNNENLTDEEKAVITDALADADNLADNLVTAEQGDIDALVKELKDIKADADEAINNKELGINKITEATSGVKVQFIDASGLGTIDSVQLGEDEGFIIRVTNGNADSNITVTGVSGVAAEAKTLEPGKSADYRVEMPAAAGIYEYAITYTIDGLKDAEGNPVEATTKAYLYVKDEAYNPYHFMDEQTGIGGVSKWDHYVEATNYGDFTLISENTATKFSDKLESGTKWYSFGTAHTSYDYDEDGCQAGCTTSEYKTGDGHAATYGYFVDTSLAPTWQAAGFRLRIVETEESTYQNAPLKTIRVANDQTYLDGIKGDDKTFTLTFYPSATGTPNKTWAITSTGTLDVATYANPDEDNELLFGEHKNKDVFDENTVLALMTGEIPSGVNEAKFMLSPRIEFNGTIRSESVTMTSHIYLTSYDKAELREAVANAETAGYNAAYFDGEKYAAYEEALMNAKEVLGKAETSQTEIDAATAALNAAIADLAAAEAKFVLTVTHSIRDGKDMSFDATHTVYDYYLANGDVTPDYTDLTDKKINKYDDKATINVTEDKTHTYNYWYIDYSGVQGAIDAADAIINDTENGYSEEYKQQAQTAKDALEDILAGESATTTPTSQSTVDDAIDAVTALTGHTCNEDVVIPAEAATCTATGLTEGAKCSVCGKITKAQTETPKAAHTPGAVVVENNKTATCTAEGSYDNVTYCTACGVQTSKETITVDKIAHTPEVVDGKDATCTETGLTEGSKCSVCGETLVEQTAIDALGHKFSAEVTANAATCLAPGNAAYKQCTVCQLYFAADAETDSKDGKTDTATFTIAQLAHSYTGDYVWYSNAEPKTHAQKCVNGCGEANPETTECTFETTTEAPTCTVGGKTIYTCSVCNNSYYTSIAANGHTWDKTTEEFFEDATSVAGKVGYYSYKCSVENCDGELKIYVEAAEYDALDNLVAELKEIIANNDLTDEAKKEVQDAIDKAEALPDNLTKPATDEESGITTPDGQGQIDALVEELTGIKTEVNTGIADGSLVKPNSDAAEKAVEAAEGLKETVENLPQEDADAIDDLREQLNEILDEIEADDNPTDAEYQDRLDAIEEAAKDIVEKYADCSEGHAWKEIGFARPTQNDDGTWNNGTYTYECENCGATKTEPAVRATYTEYDNAKAALEALKGNAAITAEAKAEIEKVLADNRINNNLVVAEQSIVDAAANALKAVLGELTDENGKLREEYEKVDFTNYNAAVNAAEALKDVMTDEDKAAVEAAKKTVTDAEITEETSKADGQKTLDDAAAAIAAINAKYGDCANGNHNWGTPELTKKPTADEQGEYTETCGTCGTTQITKVDLADYSKLDAAVKALEELAKTENLTDEAKTAIEDALEKAENLDKNLPDDVTTAGGQFVEGGQDEIDALVTELNGVVADTNTAIGNGSALKPDYSAWEEAETAYDTLDKTNVKPEIIAEANKLKAEIAEKQLDDTLTQATATQQDINNATTRLNEIIAGINDGSLVKPDYTEADKAIEDAEDDIDGGKLSDEDQKALDDLKDKLDEIKNDPTSNKKDDQTAVDSIKDAVQEIVDKYSECAKGNHAYETETVLPTCTEKGYDLHTCKVCAKTYKDNYVDETGHIEVVLDAVEPTCSSVGLTEGKKCEKCGTITVAQEEIPMLRHTDADGDGVCDVCGKGGLYDGCTCLCHNNHWFWRLVYLIIRIIWRVFRIHQICPCGAVHF